MSRKVCVVVTARPSYARIKSVLEAVRDATRPRAPARRRRLRAARALRDGDRRTSRATASTIADASTWSSRARTSSPRRSRPGSAWSSWRRLREPAADVVVTVADRYETLATAIAAVVHEHPARPRPGRRDHRARSTRRSATRSRSWPTSTSCPPSSPPSTCRPHGREPASGVRHRSARRSTSRPRRPTARPRLRPLRALRRRRPSLRACDGYVVVHAAPGHDRVRRSRATRSTPHSTRSHEIGIADVLVLAQRRRRLRRHLEGDPRLPRERRAGRTCTSSGTCRRRTSSGCSTAPLSSSATRASPSGSARSSASPPSTSARGRPAASEARTWSTYPTTSLRSSRPCASRSPTAATRREHIYGDGRSGERIAEVLASAPLTIEKRLWY